MRESAPLTLWLIICIIGGFHATRRRFGSLPLECCYALIGLFLPRRAQRQEFWRGNESGKGAGQKGGGSNSAGNASKGCGSALRHCRAQPRHGQLRHRRRGTPGGLGGPESLYRAAIRRFRPTETRRSIGLYGSIISTQLTCLKCLVS